MPKSNKKGSESGLKELFKSQSPRRVHFIGIGGVSMHTLARLLVAKGMTVSGSDREESDRTRILERDGITVYIGHDRSHVDGADLVVYSHAISDKNPEYLGALNLGIPTVTRGELLGRIMLDYKSRIGISGTHGKSTTVAMLDLIFTAAMCEPTTLSGAELTGGDAMRIGKSELLLYEACEYKDSFLSFCPTVAVALNLELDHTDYFPDIQSLRSSFVRALSRASTFSMVNCDDENLSAIIHEIKSPVITFGQSERADYRYLITSFGGESTKFTMYNHGVTVGVFEISVPGVHNITNAAAAIAVALEYGIDREVIASAIRSFRSVPRRMELVGNHRGRAVYYDYAHHPTEISATINTLRSVTGSPLTVVFKPHTYSRTASLWDGFTSALSLADHVILTDIYPAREEPITGISSRRLSENIGKRAMFSPDSEVPTYVDNFTSGAIVVMGAGDLEDIKNRLIRGG